MVGVPDTRYAFYCAVSLGARAILIGGIFFFLPPSGELPFRWQVVMAFPLITIWCYSRGVFGRQDLPRATLETIPLLWMSLKFTGVIITLAGLQG